MSSYYDILEITKNASQDDVKKAYRKKVLVCHPDKGGDSEVFKKIQQAYEVLSNNDERKKYDELEDFRKNDFTQFPHFKNIFENMKKGFPFPSFEQFLNRKTKDLTINIEVTLEDLCQRKVKNVTYKTLHPCSCCSNFTICSACQGQGIKVTHANRHGMTIVNQTDCLVCKRTGKIYNFCSSCNDGYIVVDKNIDIHLTPQHENGFEFVFSKQGNQEINKEISDLICIIQYKKHEFFEVKDKDLILIVKLSLKEALCGFERNFIHPNGSRIPMLINDVISYKNRHVIKGYGMVDEGNLIINYDIDFPKLNEKIKDALKQILD